MIMSFTQTNQVMLLKKWTKKSNEMSDFKSVIGIVTKTVLVIQTFLDTSFLVLSILWDENFTIFFEVPLKFESLGGGEVGRVLSLENI